MNKTRRINIYHKSNERRNNQQKISNCDNPIKDGIYKNQRFATIAASILGCPVSVREKNGTYEGILHTLSAKMDIVLNASHKSDPSNNFSSCPKLEDNRTIFCSNFVSLSVSLDPNEAVKDYDAFIDSSIGGTVNGIRPMNDLEPWECGATVEETLDTPDETNNNWDAEEMFRVNHEKFNVKSTYDECLPEYTTPLQRKNTLEFKKSEERAMRLAKEIEKSSSYNKREIIENGDGFDEEEKFSAVHRLSVHKLDRDYSVDKPGRPSQLQKALPVRKIENAKKDSLTISKHNSSASQSLAKVSSKLDPSPSIQHDKLVTSEDSACRSSDNDKHSATLPTDCDISYITSEPPNISQIICAPSSLRGSSTSPISFVFEPPVCSTSDTHENQITSISPRYDEFTAELDQVSISRYSPTPVTVDSLSEPKESVAHTEVSTETVSSLSGNSESSKANTVCSDVQSGEVKDEAPADDSIERVHTPTKLADFKFNPNAKDFVPKTANCPQESHSPSPQALSSPGLIQPASLHPQQLYCITQNSPLAVMSSPNNQRLSKKGIMNAEMTIGQPLYPASVSYPALSYGQTHPYYQMAYGGNRMIHPFNIHGTPSDAFNPSVIFGIPGAAAIPAHLPPTPIGSLMTYPNHMTNSLSHGMRVPPPPSPAQNVPQGFKPPGLNQAGLLEPHYVSQAGGASYAPVHPSRAPTSPHAAMSYWLQRQSSMQSYPISPAVIPPQSLITHTSGQNTAGASLYASQPIRAPYQPGLGSNLQSVNHQAVSSIPGPRPIQLTHLPGSSMAPHYHTPR